MTESRLKFNSIRSVVGEVEDELESELENVGSGEEDPDLEVMGLGLDVGVDEVGGVFWVGVEIVGGLEVQTVRLASFFF